VDGGARVEYENSKNAGKGAFVQGTKMQSILESAMGLAEDVMRARFDDTGLIPRDASFWEGFSFHLVEEEKGFGKKDPKTGEYERTYKVPICTEVFGFGDGDNQGNGQAAPAKAVAKAPAKKAAVKKAAAKPTPPARPEPEATEDADAGLANTFGIDDDVFGQLVELARANSADYYAFAEKAYELDAIVDPVVQGVVDDETGLFAAANEPF
jgi:hypothetical protein